MATKTSSKRSAGKFSSVQITERRLLTQAEYDSIVSAGCAAEVLRLWVKQAKGPQPKGGQALTNAERQRRFRERHRSSERHTRKT